MGISGDIKTMPVTDLLQWIEITVKTGIVEFSRKEEWKKIFFQAGQILFVSSSKEDEKIGRFLIRQGHLTEDDLYDCLDENERTGKKLTMILEERQLISHKELYEQVVMLIKEILFDLFLWKEGRFEFSDVNLPAVVKGPLALKTGQVLFNVLTQIDESRKDAYMKEKVSDQEKKVKAKARKKVRGRIVFKVDEKKFTLPGSYEKSELPGIEKIDEKKKEEEES